MKTCTLLFLIKRDSDKNIKDILLAMKKRGFGVGKYNGVGGKVEIEERVEEAAIREAQEEIGVSIIEKDLEKVGSIDFYFKFKPDWNQIVHIFFVENWTGDIKETEEMSPNWYGIVDIPYDKMWDDDKHWLPTAISGNKISGSFTFDDNGMVIENNLKII